MTHPHAELEDLAVWRAVDAQIESLERTRDLQLGTDRPYVVGSLCDRLVAEGLVVARKESPRVGSSDGPAATAAVMIRLLGAFVVLQSLFGLVFQVIMLVLKLEGTMRLSSPGIGIGSLMIFMVPALLLLYFSRPLGRLIARGL